MILLKKDHSKLYTVLGIILMTIIGIFILVVIGDFLAPYLRTSGINKTIGNIFFTIPYIENMVFDISKHTTIWLFGVNKTAFEIIYIIFVSLYITICLLLFFLGLKLWSKLSIRKSNDSKVEQYLFGSILPLVASILLFIGIYTRNQIMWLSVCLFAICGILTIIFTVINIRALGAIYGIVFTLGLSIFCMLIHYLIELIIALILLALGVVIVIEFIKFLADSDFEYDSINSYKHDEDNSKDKHHWLEEQRYAYDEKGNQLEVGTSGDYVRYPGQDWIRVEKTDDGYTRIDDSYLRPHK